MSDTLADLRLLDAHMRETFARKERVGSFLTRLGRQVGFRSETFVEEAVSVVLAGQREQALATWSLHSLAAELADPLGRSLDVEPPLDVMIGAATHDGTPLETIYRRPGTLLGELAVEGVAASLAQSRAESMVYELADVDLSVASRKAEQVHAAVDRRVVGYRRVPNAGACKWCRYIATQRYKKAELAPAHAYCGCGTREIYRDDVSGSVVDPVALERIKSEGVPTRYGERKREALKANRAIEKAEPSKTATLRQYGKTDKAISVADDVVELDVGSAGGYIESKYRETLDAIGELHGVDPDDARGVVIRRVEEISVKGNLGDSGEAAGMFTMAEGFGSRRTVIQIKEVGLAAESFTLSHEYGHRIDLLTDYRWYSDGDTPAITALFGKIADEGSLESYARRWIADGQPELASYFTNRQEVWARAYSQWVAGRVSADTELGQWLRMGLRDHQRSESQWADDVFEAEIAPLVEGVLRERGLMR